MELNEVAEFIELIQKMRQAQKDYFKSRDKNVLEKSKSLERAVDKRLPEFRQWVSGTFLTIFQRGESGLPKELKIQGSEI